MNSNVMKNMVVLKDLPSNIIEEALIIFKDDIKIHKKQIVQKNKIIEKEERANSNEYMLKEAEMIIADYISKIEEKECKIPNSVKILTEKYKRLKALTIFLTVFLALSIYLILLR